ncbi:MAG: TadE/TadG family type IV pilus assembly protein [Clostridia bacterium]|jgi:hypothetical protein
MMRNQKGQSTVEFALVLPILIFLMVVIAELGFAFNAYVTVVHTAREVARMASISTTEYTPSALQEKIESTLHASNPLLTGTITWTGGSNAYIDSGNGKKVKIDFTYAYDPGFLGDIVSGIAKLMNPDSEIAAGIIPLRASAVMAVE